MKSSFRKVMVVVCAVASIWSLNSFAGRGNHGGGHPGGGHHGGGQQGGGNWKERHPARAFQNRQLSQERQEVRQSVREGEMTRKEGREQMHEINEIQRKQHQMARENQNGGHLTKDQVKEINGDIKDLQH